MKINKTQKLYVGGKFIRSESGRYFELKGDKGQLIANVNQASRKDFREAVVVAIGAQTGWAGRTAYNRSQILYRISEIMQDRQAELMERLTESGLSKAKAQKDFQKAIDTWIYYAGWCDKYQQIYSSVNPVASAHFNFSVLEPVGTVAAIGTESAGVAAMAEAIAPVIAGGNTIIYLAGQGSSLVSTTLSECLATSDVPGGVVNILTGVRKELIPQFAGHKGVNSMLLVDGNQDEITECEDLGTINMKRCVYQKQDTMANAGPDRIKAFQEVKTTWHPIEKIGAKGSGY